MKPFKIGLVLGAAMLSGLGAAEAQQVVKVGTSTDQAPWAFSDPKSKEMSGFMVDVIRAVGKELGVEVQFQPLLVADWIPSMSGNKVDLLASAVGITPERSAAMDFAQPLAKIRDGLLVLKTDTTKYKDFNDLKGTVAGALNGASYVDLMKRSGAFTDVKTYPDRDALAAALKSGAIKAAVVNYPGMIYSLKQGDYPELQLVDSYLPILVIDVAIGVHKGDAALLGKVNGALAKLKADGTINTLLVKWSLG